MDITDRVEAAGGREVLLTVIERAAEGMSPELESALAAFGTRYARMHGGLPGAIDRMLLKQPFDWQVGRYLPPTREHAGTVRLSR